MLISTRDDEGIAESGITVSRFKGLGERNPEQLRETTLCSGTRRLVPFQAGRDTIAEMAGAFTLLTGMGEAADGRLVVAPAYPAAHPALDGNG